MGAMDHFGSAVMALHLLRCIQGKMCHLACCIDPSRHKRPWCSIASSITTVSIIGQSLLKVVPAHPSSDILMNRLTGDVWVPEKASNPDLKKKTSNTREHMFTYVYGSWDGAAFQGNLMAKARRMNLFSCTCNRRDPPLAPRALKSSNNLRVWGQPSLHSMDQDSQGDIGSPCLKFKKKITVEYKCVL